MAIKSGVTVTRDGLKAALANVKQLTGQEVMVGVPAEDPQGKTPGPNDRKDGAGINNAALAYIHEHGAPEANIPARPFLAPGVESAKGAIVTQMKNAGTAAMDGKPAGIEKALNAAGLAAQNGARAAITDGDFEPLTPAAAISRMRRRSSTWARYKAASPEQKSDMIEAELSGAKPLIDSGQLRSSIAYVIRKK